MRYTYEQSPRRRRRRHHHRRVETGGIFKQGPRPYCVSLTPTPIIHVSLTGWRACVGLEKTVSDGLRGIMFCFCCVLEIGLGVMTRDRKETLLLICRIDTVTVE